MGGAQALKRFPRKLINFPQRRPGTTASQPRDAPAAENLTFFSSLKGPSTVGGKASLQPKRTPVSNEEIEAILLGGCI